VKLPFEDIVMPVNERLTPSEELSSDVGERTIFREMTCVGGGIPGIPSSDLFLNNVPNSGFVR
jgi:hypothetical protein